MPFDYDDYYQKLADLSFEEGSQDLLYQEIAEKSEILEDRKIIITKSQMENLSLTILQTCLNFNESDVKILTRGLLDQVNINESCKDEGGHYEMLWAIANTRTNALVAIPIMIELGLNVGEIDQYSTDVFNEVTKQFCRDEKHECNAIDREIIALFLETGQVEGFKDLTEAIQIAKNLRNKTTTIDEITEVRKARVSNKITFWSQAIDIEELTANLPIIPTYYKNETPATNIKATKYKPLNAADESLHKNKAESYFCSIS